MLKFIEVKFPLVEVNTIAEYETAFLKRAPRSVKEKLSSLLGVADSKISLFPKLRNIMYYPARLPPSATRAVTLASVLDSSVDKDVVLKTLGFEKIRELAKKSRALLSLFVINPERELVSKYLTSSVENYVVLDPMAGGGSIPLEAKRLGFTVIAGDYNPVAYLLLRATIEYPAKYGAKLYRLVNEEARKLIEYVKKEVGRFYPENSRNTIIVPSVKHDCGAVVPLVKEITIRKDKAYATWVRDEERKRVVFKVSDKPTGFFNTCPFCGKTLSFQNLRRVWVEKHKEIINRLLQGDETVANEIPSYYTIMAVSITTSKYREAMSRDEDALVDSAKELAKIAREEPLVDYLPVYEIPVDNEVFRKVREEGLDFWHYLFTPRQLLVMYKIVSYIRRRGRELKNTYGELGVAVALYLALGLAKMINFYTILTQWDSSKSGVRDFVGSHYALSKKARVGFDFVDGDAGFGISWAFEAEEDEDTGDEVESSSGGILPVLKLLCESLEGLWYEGRDAIYLWDAREIDKILPLNSVDLVNVDPPYYEQHDYGGVTEFFWIVLQTALKDLLDDLFPRDRVKLNWSPYDPVIPRNIEMKGTPPSRVGEVSRFGEDFKKFLEACGRVLKPDGLLVVWYSYGKLSGWEELFYRFYETGYAVTKVWQVWTQSPQRRVALHTKAFFTSLVIVARPRAKRELLLTVDDVKFENEISKRVKNSLLFILGTYGFNYLREALVTSIADGIAGVTLFNLLQENPLMYTASYRRMVSKALEVSINTVLKELLKQVYEKMPETPLDSVSRLYFVLLLASDVDSKTGRLQVSHDFANRVSQVLGVPLATVTIHRRETGEKVVDEILNPRDMAKRSHAVSRAIALIYELVEILRRAGIRSAEEYAKRNSTYAPLALAIVSLAWRKLGFSNSDLENSVKTALMKVIQ